MIREIERLRARADFWQHVAGCEVCRSGYDGCETGQALEWRCQGELGYDPYEPHEAVDYAPTEPDERMIEDIRAELRRARHLHPGTKHLVCVLSEEAGEVAKAMYDHEYAQGAPEDVVTECIQTAAMAIRVATEGDSTFSYVPPEQESES